MSKYQYAKNEFALMEHTGIPLAVYQYIDKRVISLVISDGFCRLFGYSREEVYDVMDNDMYRDTHPDDISRISNAAISFAREETEYNVVYRTRKGDSYEIIHAIGQHIYKEDGSRIAVVSYTDEGPYDPSTASTGKLNAAFQEALHKDSLVRHHYYDHLTGLPSMSHFFELAEIRIQRLREEGKVPAILFMDLAGMKFFNRKFGFGHGDDLLRGLGRILVEEFGNENCSRFGQDHFVVLTDTDHLEEKIRRVFDKCRSLNSGTSLPVRTGIYLFDKAETIDIATACDRAKYASDIIREVTASEYRYFNDGMLEDAYKRQYIINNIDRAISENWIQVYYQPIVRAVNGKVCDEEALARWIDPEKGMFSPADFIPVLEDTRLIWKLDLFVLNQVLNKMKGQADAGLHVVPQSLNLSRADFDSLDIVEVIRKRVDEEGIERDKLTIEITESIVGKDFEFMKEQIQRFRDLGFRVWMDDFGSGYSSLDVLQNIRFDLIKFDMRFMQRFFDGPESKIILTELVRMAVGLNIECLAEGVEKEEQAAFLRDIGCMKLQGYYYCKPIPPEEIVRRNQLGIQIGYENPDEALYYESVGRVNLFDVSSIAGPDLNASQKYFDTLPMAVLEINKDTLRVIRANKTYRDLIRKFSPRRDIESSIRFSDLEATAFANAVRQCAETGSRILIDDVDSDNTTIHAILQRIGINPVTGSAAVAVGVLSISDSSDTKPAVTYANIAKALSADYAYLYYINLTNDQFVEFSSGTAGNDLSVERHGKDFFQAAVTDAKTVLYSEDYEEFIRLFTRDNILQTLKDYGSFIHRYRMATENGPRWVMMKINLMPDDPDHIIIGVTDIDAQIRQQDAFDQVMKEAVIYSRINALAGNYICIYNVDPETEHYTEFIADSDFESLGLRKEGMPFFERVRKESPRVIHPEDLPRLLNSLTKENVLKTIEAHGSYEISYRMILNREVIPARLKAVWISEKGHPQLIIGVNRIED